MRRWTIYGKIIGTAIVAVILVRTLLVTSCFIPSSGMENSLYKGEGVLVNKWSYGLRLPFPSMIGYHRWAPEQAVRGDVVLFNNPLPENLTQRLEARDVFISRCIGTPGDTLLLNEELMAVDGEVFSPDTKELYVYSSSSEDLLLATLSSLGLDDNVLVGYESGGNYIRSFSHYEFYLISQRLGDAIEFVPLKKQEKVKSLGKGLVHFSDTTDVDCSVETQRVHPFVIPARGKAVRVYPWNAKLLCNTLISHEQCRADVKGDTLLVNGRPVAEVTFTKDYYWVASNDPVNFNDSRLFGFVPEDHLIGKASYIWYPARKGRFFQRVH